MAGQIEYVIRMMEVLQDIVLTDLQSQNLKTSGGSRQGSKQNQGKVGSVCILQNFYKIVQYEIQYA